MGGCRCTYRNCTMKSDGKTHMFHYPVFEKVRCHQWLVNAGRLDFLNLKVSQLKNRCVCQHHFKDENFMNFKKEKLTYDAVPTEDGPYCDSSKWVDYSQEITKLYPITIEDIENEYYSINDKRANFSMRYGDFLTNSDLIETSYVKHDMTTLPTIQDKTLADLSVVIDKYEIDEKNNIIKCSIDTPELFNDKISLAKQNINKPPSQPILVASPYTEQMNTPRTPSNLINLPINANSHSKPQTIGQNKIINETLKEPVTHNVSDSKIRIISETKITGPVTVTGKFEPVSPYLFLTVPSTRTKDVSNEKNTSNKIILEKNNIEPIKDNISVIIDSYKTEDILETQKTFTKTKPSTQCESSAKVSVLKNKITPERVAAIEEKRKFNMKLRDIIESCLLKLEEPEKVEEEKSQNLTHQEFCKKDIPINEKKELSVNKDYNLNYIEARMNRMETVLLNKIDQNSQRIVDLKRSLASTPCLKKTVSTQTAMNESAYKKHLYNEISKYLSPDANNQIYQELFIDKYSRNSALKCSPTQKRRRCK